MVVVPPKPGMTPRLLQVAGRMRNIFQPSWSDEPQAGCNSLQIRRFALSPFGNSTAKELVRLSPVERLTT
jgi:hypothetical protein